MIFTGFSNADFEQHKLTTMNNSHPTKQDERHQCYEDVHFVDSIKAVWNYSLFSQEDIDNFQRGTHYRLYDLFGSHFREVLGKTGYYFAVWAPNATYISVVGDFNNWDTGAHPLFVRLDKSGIWEGFIPGIGEFENYKYYIVGFEGAQLYKGDPFARHWELRPATSSIRSRPARRAGCSLPRIEPVTGLS